MAAHARSRRKSPVAGARKTPRPVRTWRRFVPRPSIIGIFLAAAMIASLPYVIDVGEFVADVRDWFTRTFGLGLFVIAAAVFAMGIVIARQDEITPAKRNRYLGGIAAFGFYIWGALGLNHADWRLGNVEFAQASLGGELGNLLVSRWWSVLLWMAAGILALWALAPSRSAWLLRNTPVVLREGWDRRYPHTVARAVWRTIATVVRGVTGLVVWTARLGRGGEDGQWRDNGLVIGGPLRVQAVGAIPVEMPPGPIRFPADPGSPRSAVSVGAAFHFLHDDPVEEDEEPEPEPIGLTGSTPPPAAAAAEELAEDEPAALDDAAEEAEEEFDPNPVRISPRGGWQLPEIAMFHAPRPSISQSRDNAARAQLIVDTLGSFGVDASVAEINEGPTVTQFGVEPGWEVRYKDVPLKDEQRKTIIAPDGQPATRRVETARTRVRVNRITSLQNDLALALAAPSLRIEAPVPGRAIVGIEVPNDSATVVTIRGVMETAEFQAAVRKSKLALPLGKGVTGAPIVADLAKMPHLLIAGATGSGKSVCMNAIVCGILKNATPDDVRFVMVDPKRVELTGYSEIPHLALSEVIVDMEKVVATLQAVVREMEARYKKFADAGVRNIESYNQRPATLKRLPYWVVLIDELADLMMVAPFEVEKLLCRLAQLARATGIHLVVATQRPSVDVITGLIKANFPTRIAFAMTSVTDSRTVLDMGGAEKLLGRGDMLFFPTDAAKPVRIQGVYVSDDEVQRIVSFWTDERFAHLAPERSDDLLRSALREINGDDDDFETDMEDPIYAAARDLARRHRRVSPSMLQRRLEIGDVKAQGIIERLYDEGIVGPPEDGESRRVIAPVEGPGKPLLEEDD